MLYQFLLEPLFLNFWDIFLMFLLINLLISLNFPSLWVPINNTIFFSLRLVIIHFYYYIAIYMSESNKDENINKEDNKSSSKSFKMRKM